MHSGLTPAQSRTPTQSTTPEPLHSRLGRGLITGLRQRPMLCAGGVTIIGIILADWQPHAAPLAITALLAPALALGLWRRWQWWAWLPLLLTLAAKRQLGELQLTRLHPLRQSLLSDGPAEVTVTASLQSWPQSGRQQQATAVARITQLHWPASRPGPSCEAVLLRVHLPNDRPLTQAGLYRLKGWLDLPRPAMNPASRDPRASALREGWVAELDAGDLRLLRKGSWLQHLHFTLNEWAQGSRDWMRAALCTGLPEDSVGRQLILAMALGNTREADSEAQQAFRQSGTLHVFAVSGLHVMLLAAIGSVLLRLLGGQRWRSPVLVLLVLAYAWITGWQASAARAALMISLVLLAPLGLRQSDLQNSLGFAAALLLLAQPQSLFSPGFQLSFAVLWAIALGSPILQAFKPSWLTPDPLRPASLLSLPQRIGFGLANHLHQSACTSAAAWLGSLPLLWGHFRSMTPIGLAANLLLVPLSSLSMALTCICLLLATGPAALRPMLAMVNQCNEALAEGMVACASFFAAIPGGHFTLDLRPPGSRPLTQLQWFALPHGGSAAFLRQPSAHWMLDCGSSRDWNQILHPFLNAQGINRLDGILMTHADAHHVGAAAQALNWGHPRLHSSVLEPWRADSALSSLRQLGQLQAPDSMRWHRHSAEAQVRISPAAWFEVLHPLRSDVESLADDRAMVFRLHLDSLRILWLGDAGFSTECKLLERHYPLQADIVYCGCHPDDPGGLPEILRAASPRLVILAHQSSGEDAHQPHNLRRTCQDLSLPLWDLAIEGGVELTQWPDHWRLQAFTSGRQTVLKPSAKPQTSAGAKDLQKPPIRAR